MSSLPSRRLTPEHSSAKRHPPKNELKLCGCWRNIAIALIDDANDCSSPTSPLAKAKPHKLTSSCSPSFEKEHTSASVRAAMEETRGTVSKERFSILLV